ncbi:MAG TPA: hypothetical protein EYN67_09360 [Flavobacteriales bacterium]|nr:hypothetical protein [Flavobacteriales bacterium]
MTTNKRLCVLQVAPDAPDKEHVTLFNNTENSDFYFVTHDAPHAAALKYCPDTTWVDTRNILASEVPKNYDYYAFIDYDYILRPQGKKDVLAQILEDLDAFEPAVLTYYPGNGLVTPFATDTDYYNRFDHSVIPFTHCGLKIVHHSLMNWFFPMITRFGGGVDACHMFNIQEIPFIKNVVCSHKMIYDNGVTDLEAPHNADGGYSKYTMDEMWKWLRPAFKKIGVVNAYATNDSQLEDSLFLKKVFVDIFKNRAVPPTKSSNDINYYDEEKLEKVFLLAHERFNNNHLEVGIKLSQTSCATSAEVQRSTLVSVSYRDLLTKKDPWPAITAKINNAIPPNAKKYTMNECVEAYQILKDNSSLFINTKNLDPELEELLAGKRVAFVGPAPYLMNSGHGPEIDSYDIVVRIQGPIFDVIDYGAKTDIVQSCLNKNYGPPLGQYLSALLVAQRPRFIMCNDTVSHQNPDGSWIDITTEYDRYLKQYGVPLTHLKNRDETWDRWQLYWEIYAKKHIEPFGAGNYTVNTANFNSGYGAINVLLRYPIEELHITGIDFYNMGIPQTQEQKYNPAYVQNFGKEGTPYGPDRILHDQLGQINHFKNTVLPNRDNIKLDKYLMNKLNSDLLEHRLEKYKKLPKFQHTTR